MALSETAKGTPTITSGLVDLFISQTTQQHYSTWVFFHNLTSGDSFEITVFVNDPNPTTAERVYFQVIVNGTQTAPATFIPFVPTNSYRITAQKLTGTDRIIDWVLYTSN